MSERNQRGFTLIELLIVVAIIGIVAAISVPSLMNAVDRGRQTSTLADLRVIGGALERYAIDHNVYPTSTDLPALQGSLEPNYIKKLPTADGWKNPFIVQIETRNYTVTSIGKDGVQQASPAGGATHSFADDVILVDGAFYQAPEGEQN